MSEGCLAVIPARGGSKGIPRKNLRPVGGTPLVARAVETARAAAAVTRVVVSTDDAEIADVARRHGAEVVMRPAAISGDAASSESAVLHCLDELAAADGYVPELVMLIQCTSPLTEPSDLDGAVAELRARGADSCFTAVPFHHFLWERTEAGAVRGVNHSGAKRKRRQDLDPQLLENGAVYVMRTEPFRAAGDRFCGAVVAHVVDEARCLEIDEPADLEAAEAALARGLGARTGAALPDPIDAIVFDFDGVFTDGRVLVFDDGHEGVLCNRRDGLGLGMLAERGVALLILSKERNPVVSRRAEKLGLECKQAIDDKPTALAQWLAERGLRHAHTIYVGDDVNDVACMQQVGCAVCPADAHPRARAAAKLVLAAGGGDGAVRELCDLVLARIAGDG